MTVEKPSVHDLQSPPVVAKSLHQLLADVVSLSSEKSLNEFTPHQLALMADTRGVLASQFSGTLTSGSGRIRDNLVELVTSLGQQDSLTDKQRSAIIEILYVIQVAAAAGLSVDEFSLLGSPLKNLPGRTR